MHTPSCSLLAYLSVDSKCETVESINITFGFYLNVLTITFLKQQWRISIGLSYFFTFFLPYLYKISRFLPPLPPPPPTTTKTTTTITTITTTTSTTTINNNHKNNDNTTTNINNNNYNNNDNDNNNNNNNNDNNTNTNTNSNMHYYLDASG